MSTGLPTACIFILVLPHLSTSSSSSFFFYCFGAHRDLPSFPTRRSSDLLPNCVGVIGITLSDSAVKVSRSSGETFTAESLKDRKSTRLNSSHVAISYAVFCLKKKKQLPIYTKKEQDTHHGHNKEPAPIVS